MTAISCCVCDGQGLRCPMLLVFATLQLLINEAERKERTIYVTSPHRSEVTTAEQEDKMGDILCILY
ncbi:hypothetical protein GDO81_027285 [Engystomops pustulosus]|uniref:Secreted protein n=1 Tax=Engystomops pustulosus TaxID=76066 RepID=A0AAV6ZF52_ENGPU|nr:hypothetical protein GDO81_027285 [Engystomops pustulosus]